MAADQTQGTSGFPVRVLSADIRSVMRNGFSRSLESTGCAVVVVGAADGDGLMAAVS